MHIMSDSPGESDILFERGIPAVDGVFGVSFIRKPLAVVRVPEAI